MFSANSKVNEFEAFGFRIVENVLSFDVSVGNCVLM